MKIFKIKYISIVILLCISRQNCINTMEIFNSWYNLFLEKK